ASAYTVPSCRRGDRSASQRFGLTKVAVSKRPRCSGSAESHHSGSENPRTLSQRSKGWKKCDPSPDQFSNLMPSLYPPPQRGNHSASSRPRKSKKCRIVLNVASPTPIRFTRADSTTATCSDGTAFDRYAAVIHPAVPPPTIRIRFILSPEITYLALDRTVHQRDLIGTLAAVLPRSRATRVGLATDVSPGRPSRRGARRRESLP